MPKSKQRKNHKKKIASRNKRIEDMKNGYKKQQEKMVQQWIDAEREKGLFDEAKLKEDPQAEDGIVMDGPELDTE